MKYRTNGASDKGERDSVDGKTRKSVWHECSFFAVLMKGQNNSRRIIQVYKSCNSIAFDYRKIKVCLLLFQF